MKLNSLSLPYRILLFGLFFIVNQTLSVVSAQSRYGTLLPSKALYSTTSNSNILYIGIDNNLSLGSQLNSLGDSLILKTNNGRIFFDSIYTVIPHRKGNLRIEVHLLTSEGVDTLGYLNFKSRPLPKPQIVLGNAVLKDSTYISVQNFTQNDSIGIILSTDIPASRNWFLINEFSLGYNYGGYFIGETSGSNKITNEMKSLVLRKGAGRMFSIKIITQSTTSLLHTNPVFRVFFY